jgi:hypothetical protein
MTRRILRGGIKIRPTGLAQEEPYTPQRGQQAEHCRTELREQEAYPMYTGVTLRPERRSASGHGKLPLRCAAIDVGLSVIATYFPSNAERSQAPLALGARTIPDLDEAGSPYSFCRAVIWFQVSSSI